MCLVTVIKTAEQAELPVFDPAGASQFPHLRAMLWQTWVSDERPERQPVEAAPAAAAAGSPSGEQAGQAAAGSSDDAVVGDKRKRGGPAATEAE